MTLSDAQRWVLALGAVLNAVNDDDDVHLGGAPRPSGSGGAASALRDWDIHTPEQATARLERLFGEEHDSSVAWDLGRAINVSGWCYAAYLFDESIAWGWMVRAAERVQSAYASWSDYGEGYLHGRDAWRKGRPPSADDKEQRAIVGRLLSGANSPWGLLPWKTPLGGAPPPVATRRTLSANASSLAKVLKEAAENDRIVLSAGRYKGALVLDKAIEIVSEKAGDVVIESDKGPLVNVDEVGVLLVGLTLQTTKPKGKKEGSAVVHSSGGFLRMESCTIVGASFGIDLLDEDAEVYLEGSRITSCASVGVIVEGGVLVARDTVFEKNGTTNLQIGGTSQAVVLRGRVLDSPGSGLQLHDSARVTLEGCEVERSAAAGVVVRDEAQITLADCKLRDNDTAHLWLGSSGGATATNVEVSGGGGYGIQVLNGADGSFTGCTIHDTGSDAVIVHASAQGWFRSCTMTKAAGAGVRVLTESNPTFTRCRIAENADGVVIAEAGKGRFLRCDIVSNEGAGASVEGRSSTPLFARCHIRGSGGEDVVRDKKSKPVLEDCAVGSAVAKASSPLHSELGRKLANIDVALDRVNPDARDALRAGASEATLEKLAKAVFGGKRVPDDLATFFRWHDGQSIAVALHSDDNRTPMSVGEAIDAWRMLCDPKEDVPKPWSNAWLPVFTNGAGDHLCFVTSGKGAGSLVEYWHTDTDRKTAYASFDDWADALLLRRPTSAPESLLHTRRPR